jgi:hypothetical protein
MKRYILIILICLISILPSVEAQVSIGVRVIYHIPGLTDEFAVDYLDATPGIQTNGVLVISKDGTWIAAWGNNQWSRIEKL